MGQLIGIDLGTTNSLCAVFAGGRPQLVPNAHGERLTPSIVGVLPSGDVVVGAAAKELRVTSPERCAWCFKRFMGSDHPLSLAGQQYTPIELSSLVLRSLKQDAEQFLGEDVHEAIITVPAYFNDHQRKATRLAGEMAGLTVRRIVNEPTAAALVYGFHDRNAEKQVCVIDLGGGTFDVTLMEIFEGTMEIIATAGESMLGGEDFTDRLVAAALRNVSLQLETAELQQPLRVARLRQECEKAKLQLTLGEEARIRVPDEQGLFSDKVPRLKLSPNAFQSIATPLLERLVKPIDKTLRDSQLDPQDIDDVILVGGATRMPLLRELIQDYFGREPLVEYNPDEVVALGAAVQAALVENHADVDDMVMTDVCPFTLGVEIAKDFSGQRVAGYFSPVIHRNTTIPVSREEMYATMVTNQPEILLRIYQGESRRVDDNLLLGELKLAPLPPGPAGTPIRVRFTYDLNGILEVEAFLPESGKQFRTVLTNHARDLSDEDLQRAIERLQELKFYPRDELRNRRLVLFCERVVGELNRHQRVVLEEALDAFESAMSLGDREQFEVTRKGLLVVLSQLGYVYDECADENA